MSIPTASHLSGIHLGDLVSFVVPWDNSSEPTCISGELKRIEAFKPKSGRIAYLDDKEIKYWATRTAVSLMIETDTYVESITIPGATPIDVQRTRDRNATDTP